MKRISWISVVGLLLPALSTACAGQAERAAWKDASSAAPQDAPADHFKDQRHAQKRMPTDARAERSSLGGYIALALDTSPELKAAFERWRSSVLQISQARKLPDPQISFGYFLQSVETRVGPQRAKVSLQQSFPWPTRLTAGADAAAAQARAHQKRVEALALSLKQSVESAYWKLWLVRETRRIHAEHLLVVRSLSESVLARVATGASNLADQQQVDLMAARLEDMVQGLDEKEKAIIAELHSVIGSEQPAVPSTSTPPPEPGLPRESDAALRQATREHPFIRSFDHLAESSENLARAKNAERLPSFSIGADWIITGQSPMPGVQDSGKDAVIVGAGMTIPLWQGIYSDRVDAANAEAGAQRADQAAAENRAIFELEASLSAVRDAVRRVRLYETTLVPQADSAYSSVLGAFAVGQGTVAQTLLAQRDLLELRGELEKSRADYALSWARLEQVVGRPVESVRPEEKAQAEKDDG